MSVFTKRMVLIAVFLTGGALILWLLKTTIGAAIIGGVVGGVIGGLLSFIFKEKAEEIIQEVTKPSIMNSANAEKLYEGLMSVGIHVRTAGVSEDVIDLVEKTIDLFEHIVERIYERNDGSVDTLYKIDKLCRERLFKYIKEYLDMNKNNREVRKEQFIKDVNGFVDFGKRVKEVLERKEVSEFDVESLFQNSALQI